MDSPTSSFFIIMETKYMNFFFTVVAIQMNKQSYNFLWPGFDPRLFAWVKSQPICEVNKIAHISSVVYHKHPHVNLLYHVDLMLLSDAADYYTSQ